MIIYIPRPVTRLVSKPVYDSIKMQKVIDCQVVEVIAGVCDNESLEHTIRSRNLIMSIATALNEPFFVSLDSNTALLHEDALFAMYEALVKDNMLGAVSLPCKTIYSLKGHVDLACTMYRLSAVKGIKFRVDNFKCECNAFTYDLSLSGYEHKYLDNKIRTKTVKEFRYGAN